MPAIENRIGNLWLAKQSAKGAVPVDADYQQGRWVAGDVSVARDDSSENYLDGEQFANAADFVNTIVGNGNPTFQAQAAFTAFCAYLLCGQETVTQPVTGVYEHVATPATAGGFWHSARKKVGQTVGPIRHEFNDGKMASLRLEASSAARVAKVTPTSVFVSNAGKIFAVDPGAALDTVEPLLHHEAAGQYKIDQGDGTLAVFRGLASFAAQINNNFTPWYGDDVVPFDLVAGLGNIVLEGVSILVDAQGLALYNYIMYGSTAPPVGMKPRTILPPFGAFDGYLKRGSINTITGTPAGNWTITFNGQTTANIAAAATAAAIQSAIEALANVEPGDITVTGGPLPTPVVFKHLSLPNILITTTPAAPPTVTDNGCIAGIRLELPNIKWNPDLAIPANPDGGATELGLGAEVRKVAPDPFFRITTRSASPAFV